MYKLNGKTIVVGVGFKDADDNAHPSNWHACYDAADLTRLGITKETDTIPEITPEEEKVAQLLVIDGELFRLDMYLPRCVEDLVTATGISIGTLPPEMQTRLARKVELRVMRAVLVNQ